MAVSEEELTQIDGVGAVIAKAVTDYFAVEANRQVVQHLLQYISFEKIADDNVSKDMEGITFVITGSVERFKNRKELKEAEVISRQGIFCPPIVSSQAQKANFTDLDIREMKVIPLNSKKAKLLSVHPADSYTLETGEDGNMTLKINDENNFWKQTKYLVVMIG